MTGNVILGQYVETNSLFHRLDPRTKMLCLLLLMTALLLMEGLVEYMIASGVVLGLMALSKVPLRLYFRSLKPVLFILMFTFLYHAFFTKGNVIWWSWGVIAVSEEGVYAGVRFALRIVLLMLLASILTLTTKPLVLAHGLEKLLAPLSKVRLPVEQFSLMIVIAIRFIPTIVQELERIVLAQKARGYDIRRLPCLKRMFAYVPLLVPLLLTTIQRAEQLTNAIEARAFGNGKGRTHYNRLRFQCSDAWASGFTILFFLVMLLVK